MSKLSALSRHEALVLERRLLREIARGTIGKPPRPLALHARPPGEAPAKDRRGAAAGKLKEIGLRTA